MARAKGDVPPYGGNLSEVTFEVAKDPDNFFVTFLNGETRVWHDKGDEQNIVHILRGWVDIWLDSGLRDDGTELPASRFMTQPETTSPVETSHVDIVGKLFTFSRKYLGVLPGADGKPELVMPVLLHREMKTDEDRAGLYFLVFMLSPLSAYTAKCRRPSCERYFALKQTNREYANGTICRSCVELREKNQSASLMSANRTLAETKMYSLLARNFKGRLQQPNWQEDVGLRKRMVAFLNREISTDNVLRPLYRRRSRIGITPAWFSRQENQLGIRAALADLCSKSTLTPSPDKSKGARRR